jgi:type VI protein secretion system component VasF
MAQPARRSAPREDAPVDPLAVARAYQRERARRRARIERRRARRRANLRFWLVLATLLLAVVGLSLTIWNEVVDLFGPLSPLD